MEIVLSTLKFISGLVITTVLVIAAVVIAQPSEILWQVHDQNGNVVAQYGYVEEARVPHN